MQKYEAHEFAERTAAETLKHQQQVAKDAREDATGRRITELYGKAADQLGSEHSAVRIAGLYGLERLAQDHCDPRLRQMIVNVISAYLRMPARQQTDEGLPADEQEAAVRSIALDILFKHLGGVPRRGVWTEHDDYWGLLDLNLSEASLPDFNFTGFRLRSARFDGTDFTGAVLFGNGEFARSARFSNARFRKGADFNNLQVAHRAHFDYARFDGQVLFYNCQFTHTILLPWAKFDAPLAFENCYFARAAHFYRAEYRGGIEILNSELRGTLSLGGAQIHSRIHLAGNEFSDLDSLDANYTAGETNRIPPWVTLGEGEYNIDHELPDGLVVEATAERPGDDSAHKWGRLVHITE
ncbi:pentapeptide repeat-containing protein [Amycolatopsis sp. NPDC059090]|uniref:pentapeptide repeat-containing protein n=1 Tax=unclassified Amycolatopsis TaxID=2618356 RepID=UPI00366D9558